MRRNLSAEMLDLSKIKNMSLEVGADKAAQYYATILESSCHAVRKKKNNHEGYEEHEDLRKKEK